MSEGLPTQRPTADFFGEELVDDEAMVDDTTQLGSKSWNRMRGEVGKHGQTALFALIYYVAGVGVDLVMGFDSSLVTVTHHDAVYTELTIDPSVGIAIQFAFPMANGTSGIVQQAAFSRGSNIVRVYHTAAVDFCLQLA